MLPYALVFGNSSHLPLEIEHKALWLAKKWNLNINAAGKAWRLQLNELEEWRLQVYVNAKIYKERTKCWHNQHINKKSLHPGKKLLLFNSRLLLFPKKLRTRWSRSFVELTNEDDTNAFKVNGQWVKPYYGDGNDQDKVFVDLRKIEWGKARCPLHWTRSHFLGMHPLFVFYFCFIALSCFSLSFELSNFCLEWLYDIVLGNQ